MHPNIKHLVELQLVDLRLSELGALLESFPKRLAQLDARLAAARQQLATAKEALLTSLKDRKKYELDVEQWKEKANKYKGQSFEVKTNEAYKALQHEIQNAEAEMSRAEDRLLDRMMAGEEYERQVKAAERAIQEVEAAAQVERQTIAREQAAAQKELEKDQAERQQALAAVPEDLVDHYQRIALRHGGIGLAEVRDETCKLCGVRVRPHVFQKLRRDDCHEIFHCETCTRILYYHEPAAAQAGAGAVANSSAQPSES
jgi:predicted  nucleic acid-binding Zn-ribbon protein